MSDYVFTNSWALQARPNWPYIISQFADNVPLTVIEIGAYEGQTTVFLADEFLSKRAGSMLYTIDPFTGSEEHTQSEIADLFKRFSYNLMCCDHSNIIEVRKTMSHQGLIDLYNEGVKADIVYVDGDHTSGTVMCDLALSWLILKPGGIVLCDDVHWNVFKEVQRTPRLAVDSFIHAHWHEIDLLDVPAARQCAFRKRAPRRFKPSTGH